MFLSILAHHKKNRTVKYDFIRSGRTVSKHFHRVLNAVLRLHPCCLPILPLCHQTTIVRGGSGLRVVWELWMERTLMFVLKQKTELGIGHVKALSL
ncbi:UNVERIFIED_CONTAM: hypothetical protein Sradi_5420400 [Sesamum radiatum]|uniref:DUF8040 domain-containing protein n=1 Tax=Sesamum radiatum TaxID=300843 RepID=A0AAW2L7U3_SESRA